MDFKESGNLLFLVGETRDEMGGSHYYLVNGQEGGQVPQVDVARAPAIFRDLHQAIRQGLVRACHDPSEGGLAVAVAEMAFAGGIGADVTTLPNTGALADEVLLFAESTTRFVVEVAPRNAEAFAACFASGLPVAQIGQTVPQPRLRITGNGGQWVVWAQLADLKEAWQKPLRW
jgi:phosphoribosylformylglycinamidine synthase